MNELEEVLTSARVMVENGWCQNVPMQKTIGGTRRVCAGHALHLNWQRIRMTAFGGDCMAAEALHNQMVGVFMEAIRELFPKPPNGYHAHTWIDIPQWNDWEGRTKEEVLDTFDRALKIAERDHNGKGMA